MSIYEQPRPGDSPVSRTVLNGFDRTRLAQIRSDRNLSVADLARAAGVGVSTIRHWQDGSTQPQIGQLAKVAKVLGVELDTLIVVPAVERFPSYFRNMLGISQPELAKLAGIPTSTLQGIERGEVATLNPGIAAKVATALQISVDELIQAHARVRNRPPGTPA